MKCETKEVVVMATFILHVFLWVGLMSFVHRAGILSRKHLRTNMTPSLTRELS